MIYFVYVLKNKNRYYVGLTSDVIGRYQNSHLMGSCKSSAKLGDVKNLELLYFWESPNYILASKLERFCHKAQHQFGEDIVLSIIADMPIYTSEKQNLFDRYFRTTNYERTKNYDQ
jgi:predicted GIY-YIG superfamily endonuclease